MEEIKDYIITIYHSDGDKSQIEGLTLRTLLYVLEGVKSDMVSNKLSYYVTLQGQTVMTSPNITNEYKSIKGA